MQLYMYYNVLFNVIKLKHDNTVTIELPNELGKNIWHYITVYKNVTDCYK